MHRFFVSPDSIDGSVIVFGTEVSHRIARVLRSRSGETVIALDGTGWEHTVVLDSVDSDRTSGTISAKRRAEGEPLVHLTVYQGVLKGRRFETVLQKGTELCVSHFVPVMCERSVPTRTDSREQVKLKRWRNVLSEAAEQSRRGLIPTVSGPVEFRGACDSATLPAIMPWEEERSLGLREVVSQARKEGEFASYSVFVGPEGGFTREEVEYAVSRGILPVTLGPRILRADTAPVAVAAALMYELGELGGQTYSRVRARPRRLATALSIGTPWKSTSFVA